MRQLPDHCAPRDSLAAAGAAPGIFLGDPTFQDRAVPAEVLAGDSEAESVEDLAVESGVVSFRWAGDAETTRVTLDPLTVTRG